MHPRYAAYAFGAACLLLPLVGKAQTLSVLPAPRPDAARPPEVTVWKADFSSKTKFASFAAAHKSGGFVASGDLDGDGRAEIVIGAGAGAAPEVQVYGADGKRRASFLAYAKDFRGGVRVAVGDLDGDGTPEIITAPGPGHEPMIRRFRADGTFDKPNGFLAYEAKVKTGVVLAVGDLDGDRKAEIATLPSMGGGPHLRVWNGDFSLKTESFVFDPALHDGFSLAILAAPSGARLAVSIEGWSDPLVKLFHWQWGALAFEREFYAYPQGWKHGALLGAADLDRDGSDELLVTPNGGSSPELKVYRVSGEEIGKYLVLDSAYRGAVSAAGADMDGDGTDELVTMALAPAVVGPLDKEKSIHVNLKEQRLYAYERGRVARTFLVSTGTYKYPTPVMQTTVLSKTPVKRYRWVYGAGHPDNYDIPNVKWNLQVKGPYFIHGAYWHNNFGRRMSHGCINVHYSNAEWIYGWAEVGTQVLTFYEQPKLTLPETQLTSL